MSTATTKKILIGSMAVAGLVGLAALLDIFMKMPFAGKTVMDVMFLIGAGGVIFMGWDAYRELR